MHAVARGQADKGAVYAAIFLFRIQALDIGRRGVDRRRQVSQRALVVKHVHLDFGDELLSGLFIPLNRHKFLRLFLVAANVTTGFMVDNQPFTRADVGDNRVTWNWTTALGEGDQHAIGAFDWQMTVVRRVSRHRRRSGFALLQVFCHHDAHGVAQTDFRQQIVKRGQLHAIEFALDILRWDLGEFAASAQRVIEQTTAKADRIVALKVFQQLTDLGARFRADDKVQPGGVRASARRGDNFDSLTAGERLRQRIGLTVDARADAGMTDIGMHRVGEVHRRGAGRQFDNAPFRGENVNLIGEQIGFYALDKFKRATGALLQLQQALHPALSADLRGGAAFAAVLFISPVRRYPHLRHLVHVFGTNLYLDRDAVGADHRGVQRLIAVSFRNGDVVFKTTRTRFVEAVHLAEHAIADIGIMDDNAEGVDIHDRVKTLLFEHHFAVDGVQMLFATADAAGDPRFLQTPFDFGEDLLNHLLTVAARRFDHLFNDAVAIRVQCFKAQLFELGFDVMDT